MKSDDGAGTWVLLCYRLPREPSTARVTVWRKLKRLGVAQLGDGLITLPADARTREQIDWIAQEITDAGGDTTIWLAQPASIAQERAIAARMADARTEEYEAVLTDAALAATAPERERHRVGIRLRGELRRIARRDYFPPPQRDTAHAAVRALLDPTDTHTTVAEEPRR